MRKKINFFLYFLSSAFLIVTTSHDTQAEDVCTPTPINWQTEASQVCPGICSPSNYDSWNGNYSPKSAKQCGPNNSQGSVCSCNECTTVIVNYDSTANWWASAWYIPCGGTERYTFHANYETDNEVRIKSGSTFSIGRAGSKDSYLTVNPTGPTFYITCMYPVDCDYGCPTCTSGQIDNEDKSKRKQQKNNNPKTVKK